MDGLNSEDEVPPSAIPPSAKRPRRVASMGKQGGVRNPRKKIKSDGTSSTHKERWNAMFDRLVMFKERYGHCLVPNRYENDLRLGSWVAAQRRQYKIITSGAKTSVALTAERVQKLTDIGFKWTTDNPRHVYHKMRMKLQSAQSSLNSQDEAQDSGLPVSSKPAKLQKQESTNPTDVAQQRIPQKAIQETSPVSALLNQIAGYSPTTLSGAPTSSLVSLHGLNASGGAVGQASLLEELVAKGQLLSPEMRQTIETWKSLHGMEATRSSSAHSASLLASAQGHLAPHNALNALTSSSAVGELADLQHHFLGRPGGSGTMSQQQQQQQQQESILEALADAAKLRRHNAQALLNMNSRRRSYNLSGFSTDFPGVSGIIERLGSGTLNAICQQQSMLGSLVHKHAEEIPLFGSQSTSVSGLSSNLLGHRASILPLSQQLQSQQLSSQQQQPPLPFDTQQHIDLSDIFSSKKT